MALNFQTPSQVGDTYLTILKTLKPEVDISKQDSDWWIRSRVVGGVISGAYADQQQVSNDAFPQSARHTALAAHLMTYFNRDFNPGTASKGNILVTGTVGTDVPAGTQFTYTPNGNTYLSTSDVTLTGATALIPVQSVLTGQDQNLLSGATFTVSVQGLNSSCVASGDIGDGTDPETDDQAAAAILNRIQQPPAGGTTNDYENYATEASASVTSAVAVRYLYGLGTIGLVITAGTTDIDTALNNGEAIVQTPSQDLINTVQEYVDSVQVETDNVYVSGPNIALQDVTVQVQYVTGNGSTIEPNTGLTQDALVAREVSRALYKTPPGGRLNPATGKGYVLASEIEQVLDDGLSAEPYNTGTYAQILADRAVANLSATGVNRLVGPLEIINPGNINVVSF